MKSVWRTFAILGVAMLAMSLLGQVQAQLPVDLTGWTAESYPAVSGFDPGVWTVAPNGQSVFQSVNGQPTLFYSNFLAFNTRFQGRIEVETTVDDDFIGFALGFQPGDASSNTADYLLVDWKQGNQSYDFGHPSCTPRGYAYEGLAVSNVFGIPTADEFWGHKNFNSWCSDLNNGLEELQRGSGLGNTGWSDWTGYEFKFEFTQTSLKVYVDGNLEIDITGTFDNGSIAFYNFSQASVRYSGFTLELLTPIDIKPGSCPNPLNVKSEGVLPVAILGTEDFDVNDVDVNTVALEGEPSLRSDIEDVATPYVGEEYCGCTEEEGDGYADLTLKFDKQNIVDALGDVSDGDTVVLTLTGNLKEEFGGTAIEGQDCVVIIKKPEGGPAMVVTGSSVPSFFGLSQNNPNPFARETSISYTLPASGHTTLKIYDTNGRLVETLMDAEMSAGIYSTTWDRKDAASGVYFYRLTNNGNCVTRKMTVLR